MALLPETKILKPYIKKAGGYIKSLLSSHHVKMDDDTTLQTTIDTLRLNLNLRLLNAGGNHDWYYRQWSDGTLEAWRCAPEATPVSAARSYGSVYYTDDIFW